MTLVDCFDQCTDDLIAKSAELNKEVLLRESNKFTMSDLSNLASSIPSSHSHLIFAQRHLDLTIIALPFILYFYSTLLIKNKNIIYEHVWCL